MTYGDLKDLNRTVADKVLRDKAFNIAKNLKYDRYWCGLASGSGIKNKDMADQQSAEELHTTINRNFNRRKVDSLFIDNI